MSDAAFPFAVRASARETSSRAPLFPLRAADVRLTLGGTTAIDGLNLTLSGDGITTVIGPNGAGKSLLLKMLHGLIRPDAGEVTWGGAPAESVTQWQALVFQTPVLLRRSVAANLEFVLKNRGGDPARRDALLTHVGLAHKARQPARRLSGGEAQRLALARALATDPEVLFLDEPTASLDPASTLAIEEIVREARDAGMRIVFVTHDIGQARRLADEVVFLHQGRVLEQTQADAFFDGPATDAARAFISGRIVV